MSGLFVGLPFVNGWYFSTPFPPVDIRSFAASASYASTSTASAALPLSACGFGVDILSVPKRPACYPVAFSDRIGCRWLIDILSVNLAVLVFAAFWRASPLSCSAIFCVTVCARRPPITFPVIPIMLSLPAYRARAGASGLPSFSCSPAWTRRTC